MLILALLACQELPYEDVQLAVEASGEAPVLDWLGGAMHKLSVGLCEGACVCEDGRLQFDTVSLLWEVGPAPDTDPDILAELEPFIVPPVTYGQEFVEDERYTGPAPLEPGVTYAAQVARFAPDELNGEGAVTDAQGCMMFVP
jgi:hypothetical protein